VAGAFEETAYHLKGVDLVLTGMPLRADLADAARTAGAAPPGSKSMVLVMGGSGGARRLNEVVPGALGAVARRHPEIAIVHLSGRGEGAAVEARYRASGVAATVHEFTHDMAALYLQARFAVCRSGAATCAELGAFGVPALLVPYPHAVGNHQMANARSLEKSGAADVAADDALTEDWLASYLEERLTHAARLDTMAAAARRRMRGSGAEALADLVERVGRSGGARSASR